MKKECVHFPIFSFGMHQIKVDINNFHLWADGLLIGLPQIQIMGAKNLLFVFWLHQIKYLRGVVFGLIVGNYKEWLLIPSSMFAMAYGQIASVIFFKFLKHLVVAIIWDIQKLFSNMNLLESKIREIRWLKIGIQNNSKGCLHLNGAIKRQPMNRLEVCLDWQKN